MEDFTPCTWTLIAVTCGISWLGFRSAAVEEKYIFWPEAILAWRQYYRILSSGFLHLDWMHLGMNMMSLYFFAPSIEVRYGAAQLLLIYLASIAGGNLLALYLHRHHDYRALGASGGVAGVIFANILLYPGGSIGMMFLPIGIPNWLYAIAFLTASFYGMQRGLGNVGHDAHLGGALVGLFTAAALHPDAVRYNPWLFAGVAAGTVLLFLYFARNPLFLPLKGIDFSTWKLRRRSSKGGSPIPARGRDRSEPPAPGRLDRRVDEILLKVSQNGVQSLTEGEKIILQEASEKQRRQAKRDKPNMGFPF